MGVNFKKDKVEKYIKMSVLSAKFPVGKKLPSERELAYTLDVSRVTVRSAIDKLAAEGLLEKAGRQGIKVLRKPLPDNGKTDKLRRILYVFYSNAEESEVRRMLLSSELYQGMEKKIRSEGDALFFVSGRSFDAMLESSASLDFDGLMIRGLEIDRHAERLDAMRIPYVSVDYIPFTRHIDTVAFDSFEAGHIAGLRFIEKNCRRILYLSFINRTDNIIQPNYRIRYYGLCHAVEGKAEVQPLYLPVELVSRRIELDDELSLKITGKIHDFNPDGIFCCTNVLYSFLSVMAEKTPSLLNGINEIVYPTDNENFRETGRHYSIFFDWNRIAVEACKRLYEKIENEFLEPLRILIPVNTCENQDGDQNDN